MFFFFCISICGTPTCSLSAALYDKVISEKQIYILVASHSIQPIYHSNSLVSYWKLNSHCWTFVSRRRLQSVDHCKFDSVFFILNILKKNKFNLLSLFSTFNFTLPWKVSQPYSLTCVFFVLISISDISWPYQVLIWTASSKLSNSTHLVGCVFSTRCFMCLIKSRAPFDFVYCVSSSELEICPNSLRVQSVSISCQIHLCVCVDYVIGQLAWKANLRQMILLKW